MVELVFDHDGDRSEGASGATAAGRTTRMQIAEALGLAAGGGEPLTTWLRNVPAPAWTLRPNAKDDLRETAVAMRREGRSYREIGEVVGVSKGTLSLWLRDVPLTEEQRVALALCGPAATRENSKAARANAAVDEPMCRPRRGTRSPASARASSSSPASSRTGPRGPRTSHGAPANRSSS